MPSILVPNSEAIVQVLLTQKCEQNFLWHNSSGKVVTALGGNASHGWNKVFVLAQSLYVLVSAQIVTNEWKPVQTNCDNR